jgi:hypothetical protein
MTVAGKCIVRREKRKKTKKYSYSMRPCASFRGATARDQRCKRVLSSPQDPPKDKKKAIRRWCSLYMLRLAMPACCGLSCHDTCVRGCAIFSLARPLAKVLVSVMHASATKTTSAALTINVSHFAAYRPKKEKQGVHRVCCTRTRTPPPHPHTIM